MRSQGRLMRTIGLGLLVFVLAVGCAEDVEALGRIGRRAAINLREATESARGTMAARWESLQSGNNLQARVESRLRWDKELGTTEIEVVVKEGVVELKGEVADAVKRRRAVEVAKNTTGVDKVVDSLYESRP